MISLQSCVETEVLVVARELIELVDAVRSVLLSALESLVVVVQLAAEFRLSLIRQLCPVLLKLHVACLPSVEEASLGKVARHFA
jgi:hypothetical protein